MANPKCIIDVDGTKRWYLNNQLHRVDGPAIEYSDGTMLWFLYDVKVDPIVHFLEVGKLELDKS